jgi:hypothetical protein
MFVRGHGAEVLELIAMKTARLFDVRRDGALTKGPLANAIYTTALLGILVAALLGLGKMGVRPSPVGLLIALALAVPMVLIFSLDRTRVLFQSLWLMPAAFWLDDFLPSRLRRGWSHER